MFLDIFFSMVFISGVDAIREDKKHLVIAVALSLPLLFSIWVGYFVKIPAIKITGNFFGIAFFIYMIITILRHILDQDRVSKEVIYAAIVVYLVMGVLWSFVYHMVEYLQPNSFSGISDTVSDERFLFLYFSFVTLTTLGYGDISPITPVASSMAILEAIIGQLYLVVAIALLVGLRVSHSRRNEIPRDR